ncbi:hypothetical protein BLJ79_19845 [Arthrobacter sp. UCD-GKA]|nr:hypothetical protein BLJ79_19845 [Arthrobacter sp. UCD-GKA]
MAQSQAELQSQVDGFDHIYNTERSHQGLPGRITPQQSWDATALAEEPRSGPILPEANPPEPRTLVVAQRLEAAVEQEAAVFATGTVKDDTLATVGQERVTGSIIHPSGAGS